jgi:hypothetical protein
MRNLVKWRRVFAAALIGVGLAIVGGVAVHASPDDAGWTVQGTSHTSVSADAAWTASFARAFDLR